MRTRERSDVVSGLAGAFWLARKEMGRAWLSYVLSGLLVLFPGFFAAVSISGVFELEGFGAEGRRMEGFYNAFFSDSLFLLICAFLGVDAISGGYTLVWRSNFSSRLHFLRSVPIPAGSLVGSRALCMLCALFLNTLAFTLPASFLSGLGELGTAGYLPFAGVWVGYSLLASGVCLLLELTVSGRACALISFGFAASLVFVLALLEWTLDLSLVGRTAELAQNGYGALPGISSVLAGFAVFVLLSRATVRRVGRRHFPA